jgi:hypothetical protein
MLRDLASDEDVSMAKILDGIGVFADDLCGSSRLWVRLVFLGFLVFLRGPAQL